MKFLATLKVKTKSNNFDEQNVVTYLAEENKKKKN